MREYLATADNGHDYIYFYFCSDHRAGSKANKADALQAWKKAHGRYRPIKLLGVTRQHAGGEPVLLP